MAVAYITTTRSPPNPYTTLMDSTVVGSVDFSADSAADAQLLTWMQVTKTVLSVYGERMAMAPGGALVSTEGKPLSLWAGHLRLR